MHNTGSNPIRRAAGVMAWKMTHIDETTGRPFTQAQAVAKASAREPTLSEAQLRFALDWANAAIALGELLQSRTHNKTLQELKDLTGVSFYSNPDNHPPYEDEVK